MKKLKNKITFNYIGNLITQVKSNIMKRTINILLLASVITTSVVNAGWQDDMWSYYNSAKNSALAALKTFDEAGIINEADTTKALSNLNREQDSDGAFTTFINENVVAEVSQPQGAIAATVIEPIVINTLVQERDAEIQELIDSSEAAFQRLRGLSVNEITVQLPIESVEIPEIAIVTAPQVDLITVQSELPVFEATQAKTEIVKNWFSNNWNSATGSITSLTNSVVGGTKESINSVATFAQENPLRTGALVAGTAGVVAGGVAVYKNRAQINAKYPNLFKYAGVTALATAAVVALQCKTGMFDKIIEALPMSAALATAATATTAGATTGLAALAVSNVLNVPDLEIVVKSKELIDNLESAYTIYRHDSQNTLLTISMPVSEFNALIAKNKTTASEVSSLVNRYNNQAINRAVNNFTAAYETYETMLTKAVDGIDMNSNDVVACHTVLNEELNSLRSVVNAVAA